MTQQRLNLVAPLEGVVDVGEWSQPFDRVFICGGDSYEPEPCDCGFTGHWEHRWVYGWTTYTRKAKSYADASVFQRGGHKVMIGYDERCPGCGDIERFDSDSEVRGQLQECGPVLQGKWT